MIGIIASTKTEGDKIIEKLSAKKETVLQGKLFCKGLLSGNTSVSVCICGVGKANAAHGTTLLLEKFVPDIVYSIGVSGAYPSSGLNIGDVAVADKEIYGDEGLMLGNGFRTMDFLRLPLLSTDTSEYYNEFPMFVPGELRDFRNKGAFVTVSTCTGTLGKGLEMERMFSAICENMEGAAVAHICLLSGISAVEIRGISNIVEDRSDSPLNISDIRRAAYNAQEFFLDRLV